MPTVLFGFSNSCSFIAKKNLCSILHELLLLIENPSYAIGKSRQPGVFVCFYPVLRGLHIYVSCFFIVFSCKAVYHLA